MGKPDHCICPDCRSELVVEMYGHNLECSECGCSLIVFRDSDIIIETPVGTISISLPWEKWLGKEGL